MGKTILKNAILFNRNEKKSVDILINNERIERIDSQINNVEAIEINCEGKWVIPGIIDDQVHFRTPGLTHKGSIETESRAAAAGGVTSFMEMPNTKPPAVTQNELAKKYDIGKATSTVNYSFYMGATNDNIEEVLKTNPENVCGVKIFMGSSTGNMLVDNETTLNNMFSQIPMLIATHCEDEATIRHNLEMAKAKYGDNIDATMHPIIRNAEGCYKSSEMAISMAKKYGTRLHILHISTEEEIALFSNKDLSEKNITSEVCVHHMFFESSQYPLLGNKMKCNPAIKSKKDKDALLKALKEGYFDVIATDHAPHTMEEKSNPYLNAPSGLPLIQHSLTLMMDFYHRGELSMEFIVDKMCHAPARLFKVKERGYIDEGMYADLVVIDPEKEWTIAKENIEYKCGWSPLEGMTFKGKIESTMCNGQWVYDNESLTNTLAGKRLLFDNQ